MSSLKTWVAGTVLTSVLLAAGGWFLLISPQRSSAEEIRSQTESAAQSNAVLEVEIAALKRQHESIAEFRAALAEARLAIPADAEIASLLRQIDAVAVSTGVTLISVTPGAGASVTLVAVPSDEPAAPAEADGEGEATEGSEPAPDATATPEVPAIDGLYGIPLAIDVIGSYEATTAFLAQIQTGVERYIRVAQISSTALEARAAEGGRPETVQGDVELVASGFAYVVTNAPVKQEAVAPSPLPVAPPGRNPFLPPGGQAAG